MIFLHILVGNKEYIISGVRGTYSNAYTLIIVCTCDKDEFFVFKVHLFVNDLVSIIRFGKGEKDMMITRSLMGLKVGTAG